MIINQEQITLVGTVDIDQTDADKDPRFRAFITPVKTEVAPSLTSSITYTCSGSSIYLKLEAARKHLGKKYGLKPGPEQEKHVLNNYLISSDSVLVIVIQRTL